MADPITLAIVVFKTLGAIHVAGGHVVAVRPFIFASLPLSPFKKKAIGTHARFDVFLPKRINERASSSSVGNVRRRTLWFTR